MRRPTKACPFCESRVRFVDYKDERLLSRFITETGKILPSRLSGGAGAVLDPPRGRSDEPAFGLGARQQGGDKRASGKAARKQ